MVYSLYVCLEYCFNVDSAEWVDSADSAEIRLKNKTRLECVKKFSRKVINRSTKKNEFAINLPVKVVEAMELKDCYVKLELTGNSLVITKIMDGEKEFKTSSKKEEKDIFEDQVH